MMHDLTSIFVQALESDRPWEPQLIASAVAALMRREGGRCYWSSKTGEEWMTLIMVPGENYAAIWTQAPLAILIPTVAPTLRELLKNAGAWVIEAEDWYATDFSIDPAAIRMHNQPEFWPVPSYAVSPNGFSIMDLIFVTI